MSNESKAVPADFAAERGDELDIRGIGHAISRNRRVILGSTIATFLIALTFVTIVKARYTGEAKVLIENQENYFTKPDKANDLSQSPDDAMIASSVQLVSSRDLAREAIKALNLRGNSEFDPMAGGGVGSSIMTALGLKRSVGDLSPEERIFENYFDRLTVFNVTKSRVLQIEFTSNDPDLAARGANTVASLYIDVQSKAKRDSARASAASIGALLGELRGKLAEAEARAEQNRSASGLLTGATSATIQSQQLSDINTQITVERTQQADANAKARMLREAIKDGRLSSMSEVANNALVSRLSEQLATLRGQIALESRTLLSGHPRIKELNAQLADLEAELRSAANRAARQLDNDSLVAKARVDNLQAALEQQKKSVGGSSPDEVRQRELDREVKSLRDQVDANAAKYQEATARQDSDSTPGDARIISRAVAPQLASFPKKVPILIFGAVAGFVFSLAWVVAAELLSGRAFVPGSAARKDDPAFVMRDSFKVKEEPKPQRSMFAPMQRRRGAAEQELGDSLAKIAKTIESGERGDYALRVLITGEKESSTRAAFILSRALATSSQAILIDLDGGDKARNGFGPLAHEEGLSELVSGDASFSEVIHRDRLSRLHLVPRGHGPAPVGDDLETAVEALSQTYDFVVFSTLPVRDDETALTLGPACDYVVIMASDGTDKGAIAELRNKFVQAGAGEVLVANEDGNGRGPGRRTAA